MKLDGYMMDLKSLIEKFDIPVVKTWSSEDYTPAELLAHIKELEGAEGVVVQFENGDMVKIKSDWYIRIHRAKEKIASERRTLECILNNELDDLLPVLQDDDVERIRNLEVSFIDALHRNALEISEAFIKILRVKMTRKDFALGMAKSLPKHQVTAIFKFFDDEMIDSNAFENFLIEFVKSHLTSEAKFSIIKEQLGF